MACHRIESEKLRAVAEQLLRLARQPPASVPGISATPGIRDDYVALLSDDRVNLNCRSRKRDELMERIVEHREFIISALQLDRNAVYAVLQAADAGNVDSFEQAPCRVCKKTEFDTDNPFIFCDGNHETPVGYHIGCVGLNHMPSDDWLCPPCVEQDHYVIKSIHGRRKRNGRVEYLVRWMGHGSWETWQAFQDIPPGNRPLVSRYNASASS